MISVSPTGSPSKRSTARRLLRLVFTCATSACKRARSHSSSGSRSGTSDLPPRSTKSAGSPPSRTTCAPATRAARPPARFGHGKRRAVGLRRVGRGKDERFGLLALARAQLPQPFHCAAERELRAAEPLDEVAASADAERLERLQLAVHRAVAAGDPLGADAVARDDPLALEQQLGESAAIGRCRRKSRSVSDQRPCVAVIPAERAAREAARAALGPRNAVAAAGPQRRPGVVRHLARPDEIPERGQRLLGLEPGRREEVEPELRTASERLADLVVRLALRRDRAAAGRPSAGASSRK